MSGDPKERLVIAPEHRAEIARIQNSIPKAWLGRAIIEAKGFESVREVLERVLEDAEATPEQKKKAELVLESGYLDETREIQNPVVAELIDAYVAKEILKSTMAKKLPRPKHAPTFKSAYARFKIALNAYEKEYPEE